jgi:hypothetical protein
VADWWDREAHEIQRIFELENGNRLEIHRQPVNGFWAISYHRGPTPYQLKGLFTTFEYAMAAVCRHFAKMQKPHKIVREITDAA